MQVAQAAVDGEVSEESPVMEKFAAEAPPPSAVLSNIGDSKVLSNNGPKLDPAALLLRLPTPARGEASAAVQLPSPTPTTLAPIAPPMAEAPAAASPKGPEPWGLPAEAATAPAPSANKGGYREFLQARGQQAMQRSSQMPPLVPGSRLPGQAGAVPPPPAVPAPGVAGFMPMPGSAPSPQMAQCYAGDMSPMSQMSPTSWYGAPSFDMPPSPMMQQQVQGMGQPFSPCMQQQSPMAQGGNSFMMPGQQGFMTPTGCPPQPACMPGGEQQQSRQWGQEQLQALLMPEASFLDRDQVAQQLKAAAEAQGCYDD